MGHPLKRVGAGLWVVAGAIVVASVVLVKLSGADAAQSTSNDLVIALSDFQRLHTNREVLALDVRNSENYAHGHIPGAMHVPVRDIASRLTALSRASGGRLIVAYCSCPTESSSLRAAEELSKAGLPAKALVGGFPKWVDAGGAIETGT